METLKVAVFTFSMFGINSYVVYNPPTGECAIIDPGMSTPREEEALADFIKKHNLTVTHLLNTHLHIDHSIGNGFVKENYGVGTEAAVEDAFLGRNIESQARMFGVGGTPENVEIDKKLKDGDIINIGTGELKVIAVPGHSPGGLAFYDRRDGFLISGDSLFAGSIGRTDLAGGDYEALIDALRKKVLTLPPSTLVYPGHGPETTIAREAMSNPFLH